MDDQIATILGLAFILICSLIFFLGVPALVFHYITIWREKGRLRPNDERMLEDLWRSAKSMERRIEALETLLTKSDDHSKSP